MPADHLNIQQMQFLEKYLETGSVKYSAIAVGYSESSAGQTGNAILKLPISQKLIKEASDRACQELGITALNVIRELSDIAFAKPGTKIVIDDEGEKDVVLDDFKAHEVNVTTTNTGGKKSKITSVKTIKNSDKINALALLMKHMGLTTEKVEVEHKGSLLDLIEKSFEPTKAPVVDSGE